MQMKYYKYYKRARRAKYITAIICGLLFLGLYATASSTIDTATTIRFFIVAPITAALLSVGVNLINWFDDIQEYNMCKMKKLTMDNMSLKNKK
jgi:hypothetical protein